MRQEHRHHSDEQIRDALAFARDLVAELELPEPVVATGFQLAVNLRTAKSITEVMPPPIAAPAMAIPQGR